MKVTIGIGLSAAAALLAPARMEAALEFGAPFQDHAVLQRGKRIEVWGTADATQDVEVELGGGLAATKSAADGSWCVSLPARPAGGPYTLRAVSGDSTVELEDVMVGDVWLCSGQSNMQWTLDRDANAKEETAAADFPGIRFITVPGAGSDRPSKTVHATWVPCSPETAEMCSAVAYYFAKEQWKKHRVPIGLIVAPVGGSMIQLWISREAFAGDARFDDFVKEQDLWRANPVEAERRFVGKFWKWDREVFKLSEPNRGLEWGWNAANCGDASWAAIPTPGTIEAAGYTMDGVFWLRREVGMPTAWRGKDLILRLGRIDDCDTTYFNGQQVGRTNLDDSPAPWAALREYRIPAKLADSPHATVAVRVIDYSGDGGILGGPGGLSLQPVDGSAPPIDLSGSWKFNIESVLADHLPPPPLPKLPISEFFNAMIAPFVPYGLRGVLWYQGEGNAADPIGYRALFSLLIEDWRRQWHDPTLPFLFVQLAGFDPKNLAARNDPNACTSWVYLREAQAAALEIPHTEMATAIDLGEADNIHPANKRDVGRRLSLCADRAALGEDVVCAGPRFAKATVENDTMRIEFRNGDLAVRGGGPLEGFAVAGADRKFHWAHAEIDGDTVRVSSPEVPQPVSVRYAWSDNPTQASLENTAGLPAEPFRTDDWDFQNPSRQ